MTCEKNNMKLDKLKSIHYAQSQSRSQKSSLKKIDFKYIWNMKLNIMKRCAKHQIIIQSLRQSAGFASYHLQIVLS